jgi:hypothetical protein
LTRRSLVLLAVVTALVTTACTGGSGSDATPADHPPKDAVVTAGPATSVPFMAEGKDYRLVRDVPAEIGGLTTTYYAVRGDGSSALAVQYPSDNGQQGAPAPSPNRLLTVDLQTGKKSALPTQDADDDLTDITEASRGNGYLVWLQSAPDSYDSLTWALYSYETPSSDDEAMRRLVFVAVS